ncbi:DUF2206 domain-containing protein [Methanothermococcus sp. Ax23]|uniref:DUF2206 domain-containing protein n=1 Tax=Methanothermococcus sp. Ax23 TaxID=3156486 RepID=UPI003B9F392F
MKLQNPFKLQNWKFKKFLLIILGIQLSLLGLFTLNNLGIDITILRPLIGFIYISFIPGYLLLRILRLHNLSSIESFLYALGLSLFMGMFVGFLMNMFYPILGITNKPIAEIPIVLTMAGVVFLLCIIAYFRDKKYNSPDYINLKDIINPQVLFLSLIPFMAIFGTYLVNYYHNNILLMIMIVIIALIALIVGFTDWIDKKYYPYAIWAIAIALVWHIMLITPYVNNHDGEMVGAKSTIENGFWNYNIYGNYNSILSNNVFTPMVYFILGINLTWVYKLIFPLWISIFPVVIYVIVRKYLDCKMSFLSALVVIISGGMAYINTFTVITKQFMAEFFMSLIIVAMYGDINRLKKMIITLMFGMGVIWSHYGTSYLFMAGLLFTVIFLKIYKLIDNKPNNYNNSKEFLSFALIYLLLILSWYMYVSSSSLFKSIVGIGSSVFGSIWTSFLSPDASRGAYMIAKKYSEGLLLLIKYMNLGIAFFMVLGMCKTLWNYKKSKFDATYLGLSLYFLGILVAAVVLPFFAVMGPDRLYILALIITSPFCIIGGILFFKIISKIFRKDIKTNNLLKIVCVYVIILMLFNVGFIQELTKDHPTSIALSQNSVDKYGTLEDRARLYNRLITEYDMHAVKWMSQYDKKNSNIYYNRGRSSVGIMLDNYGDMSLKIKGLNEHTKYIEEKSYIWLMYVNLKKNVGFGVIPGVAVSYYFDFSEVKPLLKNKNKIYDNGGSQILLS